MSLFDRLGGQQQPDPRQMQQQMQHDVDQIKAGPARYLQQHGKTIPEGMTDAKEITQYLLKTGQIGTPRLQQVMRMLGVSR